MWTRTRWISITPSWSASRTIRPSASSPTHLFGIPSDVDRTRRICEEKGIFLVEDAAQAMGVEHGGRKLGTLGDVGFFSLGRGKNISCGSGGIILTSSADIAEEHPEIPS